MVLKEADEIYYATPSPDIAETIESLPQKKFILETNSPEDTKAAEALAATVDANIVLSLRDLAYVPKAVPFFWKYPATTYYEARSLIDLGVAEIRLGGSLYFDLPRIYNLSVPIRLFVNKCSFDGIPRADGAFGTYVRPEDIETYSKYVSTFEFAATGEKEEELFNIYKSGFWNGNLNLLLDNFNIDIDNRIIPPQFGEARMQCRQSCQSYGSCKLCYTYIKFAEGARLHYEKNI